MVRSAREQEQRLAAAVQRMTRALVTVASGDFTVELARDCRGDELDVLFSLVNNTIAELGAFVAAAQQGAQEDRQRLEALVAQRSRELETLAATLAERNRELQQSHDGLRRLESLRDSLIHMVVHDMRSPLAVVLGSLEVMQLEHATDLSASGRRLVSMGENAARRALDMLGTVLDLSRLEAGQMPLARVSCELGSLAREAAGALGALQGGRRLSVEAPPQGVRVQADRELLTRVFQNLLENAFKATSPQDGQVRLVACEEEGGARVEVHDDGPGIPPELRERVFDKFAQVEAPEARRPQSTGLGLTFCRLAVEAHGGRIGVKRSDLGGSAFWISLPADAALASDPGEGAGSVAVQDPTRC
jgi:signal transduction histidine kinase